MKETTEQFENAISSEDFSDLYSHTAAEFRKQYTEEQVKAGFSDFLTKPATPEDVIRAVQYLLS